MAELKVLRLGGAAILMKNDKISYLVGDENITVSPVAPYSDQICSFLNVLSHKLMMYKEYPDIISLAFFCRKANILKLKSEFERNEKRVGRGLVFHIAPSNVPVNFAFSFIFGLLSGNANIVRVPSKNYVQTDLICHAVNDVLSDKVYAEIKEQTAIIRYPQDDEITAFFSKTCNARIIWGGDQAIQNIRMFSVPERTVEIVFSDRYSLSVIQSEEIMNLSDTALKRLADNFYNDTYLMDQNACSSPQLVVWLGTRSIDAKDKFWQEVYKSALKYDLDPIKTVDKYTELLRYAIDVENIRNVKRYDNLIYCLELSQLPQNTDTLRGKFGFFFGYDCKDLSGIAGIVNTKYQTLTYFGVDKDVLKDFILGNHLVGIDRVVPIGKALDIGVIWDGYDVIGSLSRVIIIE